jgi:hypothetical protein
LGVALGRQFGGGRCSFVSETGADGAQKFAVACTVHIHPNEHSVC